MSKLIITMDGNQSDEVTLDFEDISIGRNKNNDIRLTGQSVSAFHAKIISVFDPAFMDTTSIEDLGSTNGTYINGYRINKQDLRDGDVITIGAYQLIFEFNNDDSIINNDSTRILDNLEMEALLKNATGEKIRAIADQSLLPKEVQWVAQDNEGMWWGFLSKPSENTHGWSAETNEHIHQLIQCRANGNWKHTLRKL